MHPLWWTQVLGMQLTSKLCFRPLYPSLDARMSLVWKKYQIFSKAAEKYLIQMQKDLKK